jgi:hypothetical protein
MRLSLESIPKRGIKVHVESSSNTEFIDPELSVYTLTSNSAFEEDMITEASNVERDSVIQETEVSFIITKDTLLSHEEMRASCNETRDRRPGQETEEQKIERARRMNRMLERYRIWCKREETSDQGPEGVSFTNVIGKINQQRGEQPADNSMLSDGNSASRFLDKIGEIAVDGQEPEPVGNVSTLKNWIAKSSDPKMEKAERKRNEKKAIEFKGMGIKFGDDEM